MLPRDSLMLIASLLLGAAAAGGCGGEGIPASDSGTTTRRVDVTIDTSGCDAPCSSPRYSYAITPAVTFSCAYEQGTTAEGREVVIRSSRLPRDGLVGLAVTAFCPSDEECVRCFSLDELQLGDGHSHTVSLDSWPGCLRGPIPGLPGTFPLPGCS